jgi:hypothetical protein
MSPTFLMRRSQEQSQGTLVIKVITRQHDFRVPRRNAPRLLDFDVSWCSVVSLTLPSASLPQTKNDQLICVYR